MLSPKEDDIYEGLKQIFYSNIPSGQEITDKVIIKCLKGNSNNPVWIKSNFSLLVEKIQNDVYTEYIKQEKLAGRNAFATIFGEIDRRSKKPLIELMPEWFHILDRFYLSITQGRKSRAGRVFEVLIKTLFTKLDYPFTYQPIINGKPDFVLPSKELYSTNAMDCIIFTIKRTLRERWRQIVTEGARGLGFYLATIDEKVTKNALIEMLDSRIYLIVPERLKKSNKNYLEANNVITFEVFFKYQLDPAISRWKAEDII